MISIKSRKKSAFLIKTKQKGSQLLILVSKGLWNLNSVPREIDGGGGVG